MNQACAFIEKCCMLVFLSWKIFTILIYSTFPSHESLRVFIGKHFKDTFFANITLWEIPQKLSGTCMHLY